MIFIGEHTSYTHAWIASALESGIRGSVQLMLELGLVDEAKATVDKWMARWIDVVRYKYFASYGAEDRKSDLLTIHESKINMLY